MPKQTLLSALFGGLAQGANFAGQNFMPYKRQQQMDERYEDEYSDKMAQQYKMNQYRDLNAKIQGEQNVREGERHGQQLTAGDIANESARFNLDTAMDQTPELWKMTKEQHDANIAKQNAAALTANSKALGYGSPANSSDARATYKDERETAVNRNIDRALGQIMSNQGRVGSIMGGIGSWFGGDGQFSDDPSVNAQQGLRDEEKLYSMPIGQLLQTLGEHGATRDIFPEAYKSLDSASMFNNMTLQDLFNFKQAQSNPQFQQVSQDMDVVNSERQKYYKQ